MSYDLTNKQTNRDYKYIYIDLIFSSLKMDQFHSQKVTITLRTTVRKFVSLYMSLFRFQLIIKKTHQSLYLKKEDQILNL